MRYQTEENTPCVVCRVERRQPGSVYCGIHCRTIAYNFRKRINPVIVTLTDLGFAVGVQFGVLYSIRLPVEMHAYYPEHCRSFDWPVDTSMIASLNADHLWSELDNQLSPMVAGFARWLMERDYTGQLHRDLFFMFVRTAYSTDSFKCEDCQRHFIRSPQSQDASSGLCHDCAIERIPF